MMSHDATLPKDERKYPIVPYTCLYIDATWRDVLSALPFSLEPSHHRSLLEYKLDRLWNQEQGRERQWEQERKSEQGQDRTGVPEQGHIQETKCTRPLSSSSSPIIPCLSVRTALDLLLRVKKYPPGSEVIFSAINIPSMAAVVRHHGLKIISLDVDVQTLAPKVEDLSCLITPKTVAVLFAHIFGRWSNIDPLIVVAKQHNLLVIEDCAESFCGLRNHGNPGADVSLFSFGVIKHSTAFGGAIAVVRDSALLTHMRTLYHTYPIQPRGAYLWKVLKYSMIMTLLNSPALIKYGRVVVDALRIDAQQVIVNSIRAFPNALIDNIRMRPSVTLLYMLYRKLKNFDCARYNLSNIKAEFVLKRLPQGTKGVGLKASRRNHWLFPIIVDDPDRVVRELQSRGVDAYRGATQLDLIEPDVSAPPRLQTSSPLSQGRQTMFPVAEEVQTSCFIQQGIQTSQTVPQESQTSVSIPQGQQMSMSVPSEPLKYSRSSGTTSSSSCTKEPDEQQSSERLPCVHGDTSTFHPTKRDSMCAYDHVPDLSNTDDLFSRNVDYSKCSRENVARNRDGITRVCRHICKKDAVREASEVASSSPSGNSPHASDNCRTTEQEPTSTSSLCSPEGLDNYEGCSKELVESYVTMPTASSYPSCSDVSQEVSLGHHSQGCRLVHPPSINAPTASHQKSLTCKLQKELQVTDPPVSVAPQSSIEQTAPSPDDEAYQVKEGASWCGRYPSEARYLMEHVVYLPVHRLVSFHYLEQVCSVLEDTMQTLMKEKTAFPSGTSLASKVWVKSKL